MQSLKRIVMYSSNGTVSSLAKRALSMMGEEVPKRILSCVPNWKTCEVQTWLQQVGFSAFSDRFQVGLRKTNKDLREIQFPSLGKDSDKISNSQPLVVLCDRRTNSKVFLKKNGKQCIHFLAFQEYEILCVRLTQNRNEIHGSLSLWGDLIRKCLV